MISLEVDYLNKLPNVEVDNLSKMTSVCQFVSKGCWDFAVRAIKQNPDEASIWAMKRNTFPKSRINAEDLLCRLLPIHLACALQPPSNVILALLNAYPEGARTADNQGLYPLHYACGNLASIDVVWKLLLAFPEATNIADPSGMLPLHYLAQRGPSSVSVLDLLLNYCNKEILNTKNIDGKTPIDLANSADYDCKNEVIVAMQKSFVHGNVVKFSSILTRFYGNADTDGTKLIARGDYGEMDAPIKHISPPVSIVSFTKPNIHISSCRKLEEENYIINSQLSKVADLCVEYRTQADTSKAEMKCLADFFSTYQSNVDQFREIKRDNAKLKSRVSNLRKTIHHLRSVIQSLENQNKTVIRAVTKQSIALKK